MATTTRPVRAVAPPSSPETDRRLTLDEILTDLLADQLITQDAADALLATKSVRRGDIHPLVVIADQKWKDPRQPRRMLQLDVLTEWLAQRVGLPYVHIDPFKIDFAAVTKVMSSTYATRFRILPIHVSFKEATIATCEPYVREWETELSQILRLDIKRVLANPVDIGNFQVEFYNLARSIKGAAQQNQGSLSDIANFEQLVQLGQSNKLDANDQHIVQIVDWLLQYAFEQRASDIHLEPRREAGNVRFRIDGVLHQVYQIPTPVRSAARRMVA
jgi:general secretion pathway protein E